jgi:hypothetical protein
VYPDDVRAFILLRTRLCMVQKVLASTHLSICRGSTYVGEAGQRAIHEQETLRSKDHVFFLGATDRIC